jgi:hypothetical protein
MTVFVYVDTSKQVGDPHGAIAGTFTATISTQERSPNV